MKFDFNVALNTLLLSLANMYTLLLIASCIEAAVAAYISVQPITNEEEWRCRFEDKKVSALMSDFILIPIQTRAESCITFRMFRRMRGRHQRSIPH